MAKPPIQPKIIDLTPKEFLELIIYASHITSREEGKTLESITDIDCRDSKRHAKRLADEFFK